MKINFHIALLGLILFCLQSCRKDKVAVSSCTDQIKYSTQIKPVFEQHCIGCHDASTQPTLIDAQGNLDHTSVANHANHILNSLTGSGAILMPYGGPALPDSIVNQFSCWITQGKKNN